MTKFENDKEREIWLSIYNSYICGAYRSARCGEDITKDASEIADQGLEEYRKRNKE